MPRRRRSRGAREEFRQEEEETSENMPISIENWKEEPGAPLIVCRSWKRVNVDVESKFMRHKNQRTANVRVAKVINWMHFVNILTNFPTPSKNTRIHIFLIRTKERPIFILYRYSRINYFYLRTKSHEQQGHINYRRGVKRKKKEWYVRLILHIDEFIRDLIKCRDGRRRSRGNI